MPEHSDNAGATAVDYLTEARQRLLTAALPHVVFDGWSDRTLRIATDETDTDPGLARLAFPRGPLDLLLEFHHQLDHQLVAELLEEPTTGRIRERVTGAVRRRIELAGEHREAVQRGVAYFALPQHAGHGARALWQTADRIWSALGDNSHDYNWYSKRAILASVYGATVLYWLGDESDDWHSTWHFLDRRIAGVMRFERIKATVRKSPAAPVLLAIPRALLRCIRPPTSRVVRPPAPGMPG